ncbi:MAG: putative Twin-arginine translocation protein TatB [Nitrospira sp.]|jgi:hypothetical protein|nr:putative Twin-arginine translocation protein TatB [Nitrospira sp.]
MNGMSINIELALVLGLFIIGAVVLAADNLINALYWRLTRWIRQRKSPTTKAQSFSAQRKNP